MNLTCIGSCRLRAMEGDNISTAMLNINLTHSTKDILQFLKVLQRNPYHLF